MLVLLAMLNEDAFPGPGIADRRAGKGVQEACSPVLRACAGCGASAWRTVAELRRLLEENPIAAWAGGKGTGGVHISIRKWSACESTCRSARRAQKRVRSLVREIAEWRLAEYLSGGQFRPPDRWPHVKVSHFERTNPMLFLPERAKDAGAPRRDEPTCSWMATKYEADFVKVALNVIRRRVETKNELPAILRRWFGEHAGRPGARFSGGRLRGGRRATTALRAWVGTKRDPSELWQELRARRSPLCLGLKFTRLNLGDPDSSSKRSKHMFLLVTLEKEDMPGGAIPVMQDRVSRARSSSSGRARIAPRGTQGPGQEISHHAERGIDGPPLRASAEAPIRWAPGAAPFVYCGDVQFLDWSGERPITVNWRLPAEVPNEVWNPLAV